MSLLTAPAVPSAPDTLLTPYFTRPGMSLADVFATTAWNHRDVVIQGKENVMFSQAGVEAPDSWSDTAVTIVASKYFAGKLGTPERETSIKQLISRVVETLSCWG